MGGGVWRGRHGAYLVLAAAAILACASLVPSLSSFQNWLTTSWMAPAAADRMAMPCATEGTRLPDFAVATKSFALSLAQSSNFFRSMFRRTGMEPLFRLNTSWNWVDMMAAARSFWALTLASFFSLNMANESTLKVNDLAVPGAAAHTKSLPCTLPAATNSPLAQSPINCMPASPLMTMAVARFQSRPGAFLSV